jgi:hypothetical protein
MAGLISHYRHLLRSEDAFGGIGKGIGYGNTDQGQDPVERAHRQLSDKAMGMVHEIRGGIAPQKHDGIRTLTAAFADYGYGQPDVTVHHYWAEDLLLSIDNPRVKWIVLQKSGQPLLLLLQSYDEAACQATLELPARSAILDVFTRRLLDPGRSIEFDADYGTRLLLIADEVRVLAPLAWADEVRLQADFGFGLPPGWFSRGDDAPCIVGDPRDATNRLMRITPAHPSQHWVQGDIEGDGLLRFRFRLPPIAEQPPQRQFYGFLQLIHHLSSEWPKQTAGNLALGVTRGADGTPFLAVGYSSQRDGAAVTARSTSLDRLDEVGDLVPLDTGWHTVTLQIDGPRRSITVDGHRIYESEIDTLSAGKLRIGPGWSSWRVGIPYVDLDDIVFRRAEDE